MAMIVLARYSQWNNSGTVIWELNNILLNKSLFSIYKYSSHFSLKMLSIVTEGEYYRDPKWLKYGGNVTMECSTPNVYLQATPTLKA